MKKFMSLLLVGIMMLSLVACGKSGGGKGELNVGVFYYTYSDTYISSVRTALDSALTEAGIKFQNYDGNSNQTTQNEQIDTAIAQGTNLLIVNIVTSGSVDASQAIVDKASAAGIPVIFFNRAVESDEDEGKVLGSYDKCAFVGTDAPEAGHMQGKLVGQYVVDNFDTIDLNGDGKISYAMFMGQLGNVEAIYRTQYGVEDADAVITAAGKPALEYFDASNTDKYQVDQDGNWSATAANNYMTTNLSQYNESAGNMIELVICNNDGMAEGVISALNDKGYNLGDGKCTTIPVFGVDATDAAKQLIADGKMTGTIKQDAEGMANGIAYLAKNIQGGKELMAAYCKSRSITLSDLMKPSYMESVMRKYGFRDWDSALAAIGHGGLKEGQVVNKLLDEYNKQHQKEITDEHIMEAAEGKEKMRIAKSGNGIVVKGIHDVAVRFSKCCSPVPGDEIVGFVTRGRGISVHRTDCVNVMNLSETDRARLIEAEWQKSEQDKNERYTVEIKIFGYNRTGLLVDISKIFTERKIDLSSLNCRVNKQGVATILLTFDVQGKEELASLTAKIRQIESVIDIQRTSG